MQKLGVLAGSDASKLSAQPSTGACLFGPLTTDTAKKTATKKMDLETTNRRLLRTLKDLEQTVRAAAV